MISCWSVQSGLHDKPSVNRNRLTQYGIVILQLRIYALYDRSIKIRRILLSTFAAEVVTIIVIFILGATRGSGVYEMLSIRLTD